MTFHIHLSDLQTRLTRNFETAQNQVSEAAAKLQDTLDENKGGQADWAENIQAYKKHYKVLVMLKLLLREYERKPKTKQRTTGRV